MRLPVAAAMALQRAGAKGALRVRRLPREGLAGENRHANQHVGIGYPWCIMKIAIDPASTHGHPTHHCQG